MQGWYLSIRTILTRLVVAKANSDLVAAFAKATSKEVERNSNSNTGATLGA